MAAGDVDVNVIELFYKHMAQIEQPDCNKVECQ